MKCIIPLKIIFGILSTLIQTETHSQCSASFFYEQTNLCDNTILFVADSAGNPSWTQYSWTVNSMDTIEGSYFEYIAPNIGGATNTFEVTLSITDFGNCIESTTQTITVKESPDVAIADCNTFSPFSYCDGGGEYTLEIYDESMTAATNILYTINWGDGTTPYVGDTIPDCLSHTFTQSGFSIITVTVEGENACVASKEYEFYMGGNPAVGIGLPPLGNECAPSEISFTIENSEVNSEGTTYTVTFSDGSSPLVFSHPPPAEIVHTFNFSSCGFVSPNNFSDAFHVTIEARNPCGGSAGTAEPIRVSSPPVAQIEIEPPIRACPGEEFEFCQDANNANYYISSLGECIEDVETEWLITPAGSYTITEGDSTSECISVVFHEAGDFFVNISASNPCGRDDSIHVVTIFESPIAYATLSLPSGNLCAPVDVDFFNQSLASTGSEWIVEPMEGWSFTNDTDEFSENPSFVFTKADTFFITLIASNGCGDSTWTDTIIVHDNVDISFDGVEDACEPNTIFPSVTISDNGYAASSCEWIFSGGSPATSNLCDPGEVMYVDSGLFLIELSVNNLCGITTALDTFQIYFPGEVNAGLDTSVCESQNFFSLNGTPDNGKWSGQGEIDSESGIVDLSTTGKGMFEFYYTILENTACEASDTILLEIIGGLAVNAGEDVFVCENTGEITLSGFSPSQGNWEGEGLIDPVSGQINIDSLTPDSYIYTYTSDVLPAACASDEMLLNVLPVPLASFTIDKDTACIETVILYTNNSVYSNSHYWDFGDDGIYPIAADPPVHSYTDTGTYKIILEAFINHPNTGMELCSDVFVDTITISSPPPVVAFDMDTQEGCAPLSVQFANQSSGTNSPINFVWNFGNEDTSSLVEPAEVIYEQADSIVQYIPTLIAENICGIKSFSDTITVYPQPIASFGTDLNIYCSGDTVIFENNSSGLADGYLWNMDLGTDTTFSGVEPPPTAYYAIDSMTTYEVTLIADNFCGMDTISQSFSVVLPDVSAFINLSTDIVCLGEEVCFESFATLNHPIKWDLGDETTVSDSVFCHTYPDTGSYEVALMVFGCGSDTIWRTVHVVPRPELTLEYDPIVCENSPTPFKISTNAVETSLYFGDGSLSSFNIVQHVYDSAGHYDITVVGISELGCSFSDNGEIVVLAAPEALFMHTDSVCAGEDVFFTCLSQDENSCFWSFGDTNSSNNCVTVHNYEYSDKFLVTLEVTNTDGCKDTIQNNIYIRPTPIPAFSMEGTKHCAPAFVDFINESELATGYSWDFGNDSISVLTHPQTSFENVGEYQITLRASNANCEASVTEHILISNTPLVEYEPFNISCFGSNDGEIHLLNENNYLTSLIGPGGIDQQNREVFAGLPPGSFELRVESGVGCDTTYQIKINEPDELIVNILEKNINISYGRSATLETETNYSNLIFSWQPPTWLNDSIAQNPIATPEETILYTVTATDPLDGCTDTDQVRITVGSNRDIYIPNVFSPNGDGNNDYFEIPASNAIEKINYLKIFNRWGVQVFQSLDISPGDMEGRWYGKDKNGKYLPSAVYVYIAEVIYRDGIQEKYYGDVTLVVD